ncbi:TolC family protein [Massilia sp. YMA4]|uniref:TolC family protein n=1 Tax=Massilia sp. YMA4 TaxID=1593482 RepID=UPI000DD12284|nr:TolC family protein [Massilia sp. YMA4]AXA94145.1 TolC family protein [Massilia sp. YMA4]
MPSRITLAGVALLLAQPLFLHASPAGQTDNTAASVRLPAYGSDANASVLTLEQAVAMALATSPQLRASAQDIAIAEGARLQAGTMPNPTLSYDREGIQRGNRTQTTLFSQPIELGGKRAARIALAEQDQTLARIRLDVDRAELRADVVDAYLNALTAQERRDLVEQSVQVADKAASAAARRVAAGKISPVEETRSSVAAATAKLELAQASTALALARRHLAALWGSTDTLRRPLVTPDMHLSDIPPLERLQDRLQASPQMRRARTQVTREQAQVRLERAQRIPDVTLTVGRQKEDQAARSLTVVGISVPLPLFDRNQGNLLSAMRRADKAQAELDVERVRLTQALADAHHRAVLAQQQLTTLKVEILPAAQGAFDAAVTGFELGKFSFLDVLDAQRTLFQAREQYLGALAERYRSVADLQRQTAIDDGEPDTNRITP